ncbi:MAG: histidine kinase dimerization/phospho-acceptor domain-containing protein [Rhizomicrobium sp.]
MKLSLEQLHVAAQGIRKFTLSPVFGALCVLVMLPSAPKPWLYIWYAAMLVTALVLRPIRARIAAIPHDPSHRRQILLSLLVVEIPVQILWALFVPLCWVAGDAANNCVLLIFLLASLTVVVRLYGPCIELLVPVLVLYLPFVVLYSLHTGTYMDAAMPVLQLAYAILLGMFAWHHHQISAETARQRFTIQAMAEDLAQARDEAVRANLAKSAFLASMSHELRTPMNAIIGFSDLIRSKVYGPLTPPQYSDYVDNIHVSGQHLLTLINDVLDLSKIEAGKRELCDSRIDVSPLLHDALCFVQPLADQCAITIAIEAEEDAVLIADERATRQILINLLSNAIKFSSQGATVRLYARPATQGGLDLGVADQGVGMTAAGIQKALEPYGQVAATTKQQSSPKGNGLGNGQGTGLGLPIAKALIEAHDAIFHIKSAIGVGTEIWGEFPDFRVSKNS